SQSPDQDLRCVGQDALVCGTGNPDQRGAWLVWDQHFILARAVGPTGHAEGDRRKAQRRGGRGARRRDGTQAAHRHRPGDIPTRAADPGSALYFPQGRDREMVADHQGGGHQGEMALCRFSERDAMKRPHRRQFLHLTAGGAALPFVSRIARAQAYPNRPVRMIVPFGPPGTTDIVARLIGQWLSEHLGQQFVVENRPGGAGNIGTEAVVRSPADGYTLLMIDVSPAINATLFNKLNFDFIRDVAPVANIVRVPNVMVVNPAFPTKTVPEFITYAKANPGKISLASAGIGTPNHLSGELFKAMAGVDMAHVPYRGGGPAIADLLGGQVDVTFAVVTTAIEYIRAG